MKRAKRMVLPSEANTELDAFMQERVLIMADWPDDRAAFIYFELPMLPDGRIMKVQLMPGEPISISRKNFMALVLSRTFIVHLLNDENPRGREWFKCLCERVARSSR